MFFLGGGGGSPRADALLDVGQPALHLLGVGRFQHVLQPALHLFFWGGGHKNKKGGSVALPAPPPQHPRALVAPPKTVTLSTKVFSLSGISNAVVARTAVTAEHGTLSRALVAWWGWGGQKNELKPNKK